MMRALIVALLVVTSAIAQASTKRVAVIVGNNAGNADRAALHYAETDAAKFAGVLGELGGVALEDAFLLRGKSLAAVAEAFELAKQRIAAFRKDPSNRIVLLFYFSGHSDGEALELGNDRLTFSELRRWLASAGADVRVALVDSCKSGALLSAKGGTPGPGFQIRLTDELASTGEVLLTSSAADEVALESREIAGSFFTHHFISGLRGAADTSDDGIVTLSEAYQYAYSHTIKTTGETVIGTQHPAYDYRLSGQGELVLAELSKRSAMLELPGGFERIIVIELAHDQVIAEVTADTHARIAVQPGRYAIRASRGGKLFTGRVEVAAGGQRVVTSEALVPTTIATTASKGGLAPAPAGSLLIAAGGGAGVADDLGLVPGMRLELVTPAGLSFALDAGSRAGRGFRETSLQLAAGYRRGIAHGGWAAWIGLEAGGGVVVQSRTKASGYSSVVTAGGFTGASLELARNMAVAAEATVPVEWLKRDGKPALVALPAAWLGLVIRL
jgi:Caspase domain